MILVKKLKNSNYLLLFILLVCTTIRFYDVFNIPFTHDEFSTLFRTNFNSFQELIDKGVKVDTHPAGLQVFVYYFKKLFGSEEWVIKIPFLLFGVFSIFLTYKIYSKLFNVTIGFVSAAFVTSLQFTVMYSQIARPYSSGLFFTLFLSNYWINIFVFKRNDIKQYLFYIFFGTLCLYNHHFSALMFVIISFTSFLHLDKQNFKRFIISLLCVFIFYIPHIGIFFTQLKLEGLSDWLNKPTPGFIVDYLSYVFQFSNFNYLLILVFIILSLLSFQRKIYFSKLNLTLFIWFVSPILIGYLYSVIKAPVLQYSVLIFSLPFLFGLIFGGMKEFKLKYNVLFVLIIIIINTILLINHRKHYYLFNNSCYKHFLTDYPSNISKINLVSIFDVELSHKNIVSHYIKKQKFKGEFNWMDKFPKKNQFIHFIKESSKSKTYFYYASIFNADPTYVQLIRNYFPHIVFQHNYYSGTIFLFSKYQRSNKKYYLPFNKKMSSFFVDSTSEFSKGFNIPINKLVLNPKNIIELTISTNPNYKGNAMLVSSIQDGDSVLDWRSMYFDSLRYNNLYNKRIVQLSIEMNERIVNNKNAMLKTYVWNSMKDTFTIYNYKIEVRKGNNQLYGLFYPIY